MMGGLHMAVGVLLIAAVVLSVVRVTRGELADRIIGLDVGLLAVVGLVALDAVTDQSSAQLELPLIVGLLGFLGTVTVAAHLGHPQQGVDQDR